MKIAVIGGGSWGTSLGNMLAKKGLPVSILVREQTLLAQFRSKRENTWYLPGITLSENLVASLEIEQVLDGASIFLVAVPSQFVRSVLRDLRYLLPHKPVILCASKGIEVERLKTMSEVVSEELGGLKSSFAMLSGPSFALEVCKELPTAVALGCADKKLAKELQETLNTPYFRVYTNTDVRGVELGGAVKNIIAIAAGISDGLHYGTNARAALITRGLAEMSRLGKAMGAKANTFMGLAGLGDLVLTCTGDLSRNRRVGLMLGGGQKLTDILAEMKMVAEGVKTTEAVHLLANKLDVDLPITDMVYRILYEDKDPDSAVRDLMNRPLKEE